MHTLRADPDLLFFTSRALGRAYGDFLNAWFTLRAALVRLEMAWQGNRADDFLLEGHRLLRQLWDQGEELFTMGLILFRQADRWEELDQRWRRCFRDFPRLTPGR